MATTETLYAKDQPGGFVNAIQKVAIIGAGGSIGKHLAEHLLKTGKHEVTAITRPTSKSKLADGLKVLRADYGGDSDDAELVTALEGQQVLIITMAMTAPRGTVSRAIRAAAKAGVPYVFPNMFGHDTESTKVCSDSLILPMRQAVSAEIKELGVSSSLMLASNFWYEFSLGGGPDRYGFDFDKRSLILFDGGNFPLNTTTWPQCGRAIASLLSLKEIPDDEKDQSPTLSQYRNKTIYISSFVISQRDMFESVKRVTKTTDADWTITHESSKTRWEQGHADVLNGKRESFVRMLYSRMFFDNSDDDHHSRWGRDNEVLGLPVEDLDKATAVGVDIAEKGFNYPH